MRSLILNTEQGNFEIIESEEKIIGIRRTQREGGNFSSPVLELAKKEISAFLRGELFEFSFPFSLSGTDFEQRVYSALLNVRYGEVISYGGLALKIGSKGAQRAVGRALGQNPLLFIVPCHRVIRSDGTLGGFSAGLALKRYLLNLEKSKLFL